MAPSYRYDLVAGDSLMVRVRYTPNDTAIVDLATYDATWSFRFGDQTYELTTQNGTLSLDDTGVIAGAVPPSVTKDWSAGLTVTHRLRLIDPAGNVKTLLQGDVEVMV